MKIFIVFIVIFTLTSIDTSFSSERVKPAKKVKKLVVLPEIQDNEFEQDEIVLSGIVLDRTITRFGKEFVRQFNLSWQEVPATAGVNLVIKETKLPRSGTRLVIEVKGQIIYQTYFGMRQKPMKDVVRQATYYAIEGVARANVDMSGPDLAISGY